MLGTLLAVGVGTLVIGVGFPILLLALLAAQGFATVERARIRTLTGVPISVPGYRAGGPGSRWRGLVRVLIDGRRWLDLLYGLLAPIPALVVFPIAVVWWVVTVAGLTYPLYAWALPAGPGNVPLSGLLGLGDSPTVRIGRNVAIGALAAVTLPAVLRGLAVALSSFGRGLLTRQRAEVLAERVSELTESRAAAVSAEAIALRRLERDLHDGPQQRLIRLAIDLSAAQRRLRTDPAAAEPLISGAIQQTREALAELRALSRGIAPPVLADRGLTAALTALAARCSMPVNLETDELDTSRLAPAVENSAYFVVAEALTNVAKHSGATACTVRVSRDDTGADAVLRVLVTDNGRGGAHPAKGHGLAGLVDRVRALDGELGWTARSADRRCWSRRCRAGSGGGRPGAAPRGPDPAAR